MYVPFKKKVHCDSLGSFLSAWEPKGNSEKMDLYTISIKHLITVFIDRVFLYGDLSYLEIYKAPMHSGSYQDCTTELYFVDWRSILKIKFSWAF